MKIALYLN